MKESRAKLIERLEDDKVELKVVLQPDCKEIDVIAIIRDQQRDIESLEETILFTAKRLAKALTERDNALAATDPDKEQP